MGLISLASILLGFLFTYRHGTKCAGVIAAEAGHNKRCGVGLAYNAKIGGAIYYAFNYVHFI